MSRSDERPGDGVPDATTGRVGTPEPTSAWLTITNEFTSARVRTVRTRNGERVEVVSRKLGTRVLLDPLELESLTWQTPETFSRLLEHPYGPEDVATRPLSRLLRDESGATLDDVGSSAPGSADDTGDGTGPSDTAPG